MQASSSKRAPSATPPKMKKKGKRKAESSNLSSSVPPEPKLMVKKKRKKPSGGIDMSEPTAECNNKKKKKMTTMTTTTTTTMKKNAHVEGAEAASAAADPFTRVLPSHRLIVAPMVGGSELAFRLLCRKYGADLAYTPMMSSERFAVEPEYRAREFVTTPEDRPLVAHFSANNPNTLLAAARHVEDRCDAVDINLGCPQRIAHAGHFGSYLLGEEDRELVLSMVRLVSSSIKVPLFVKIRLLDTPEDTLRLCLQLVEAGAALITIHARYRVNLVGRSGPGARDGPAKLDQVAAIKAEFERRGIRVPVISNGNVREWSDVVQNLKTTRADGIMSAEGLLDRPALFAECSRERRKLTKKLREIAKLEADLAANPAAVLTAEQHAKLAAKTEYELVLAHLPGPPSSPPAGPADAGGKAAVPDSLGLALEYLALAEVHPVKQSSVIFHTRRICRDKLNGYQLMDDLVKAESLAQVRAIVAQCVAYDQSGDFVFDPDKERRQAAALAKKKHEEGLRKAFEARMTRKAKREGKPLDFYLRDAEPPTIEHVTGVQQKLGGGGGGGTIDELTKRAEMDKWRAAFPQHCFAHHILPGGCARDRRCAFLHMDPRGAAPVLDETPSWLEEAAGRT